MTANDPILGPHPPDLADLWRAQDAPLQAGLSDADFERLGTEKMQTELAYQAARVRELIRDWDAIPEPEPEAEADGPVVFFVLERDGVPQGIGGPYRDEPEAGPEPEAGL